MVDNEGHKVAGNGFPVKNGVNPDDIGPSTETPEGSSSYRGAGASRSPCDSGVDQAPEILLVDGFIQFMKVMVFSDRFYGDSFQRLFFNLRSVLST